MARVDAARLLLLFALTFGGSANCTSAIAPSTAAPTITAVTPDGGSIRGGNSVTITGTNFSGAATVTLGGTPATNVAVQSATTITATTGPHAFGRVDVTLTVGGMGVSLPQGYLYFDPSPPQTLP
jgi:hypothetical protein